MQLKASLNFPLIAIVWIAFLWSISVDPCRAQVDSLDAANRAYQAGDYSEAIRLYEGLLAAGHQSVALHYNLGNAYFQERALARARLQYERALLIDPGDRAVRHNLQLLRSQLEDQIEPAQRFVLLRWKDQLVQQYDPLTWSFLAWLFGWSSALLAWVLLQRAALRKKWRGWTGLAVSLTLFFLLLALTLAGQRYRTENRKAIVFATEVMLKAAPDRDAPAMFALHSGTEVQLLDTLGNWAKVQLINRREGWLPRSAVQSVKTPP